MLRPNGPGISFRLDQPDLSSDDNLAVCSAVTGVPRVTHHPVSKGFKTLEKQLFKRQSVHSSQTRIDEGRRLKSITPAKCAGHRSRLPTSPAMAQMHAKPRHKQ
jgi:hypothetical protein